MSAENPESPKRRDFLNLAVGSSAVAFTAAMGYPVTRYVQPRPRTDRGPLGVGQLADFPLGGARTVLFHDRPVLVVRDPNGQVRAFSAICTHLQCIVGYVAERNQIECPCHRGVYTVDGQNLSGPPPRKLDELIVTVNEGSVILSTT